MPRLLTARDIAAEALEEIGAFGVHDREPNAAQLDRAMRAFDALVQELAGTEIVWWLRPGEVAIPLTAGVASYNLRNVLGADYPADGIECPTKAVLVDPGGQRTTLEIIRRDAYYGHQDLTTSGPPCKVHIDRLTPSLTLYTHPVIALPDYAIHLSFQTYAPDLVDEKTGAEAHMLPAAWQRWGRLATAYDISGGRVMALPISDRARLQADAERAREKLMAINNRERAPLRRTRPRDF